SLLVVEGQSSTVVLCGQLHMPLAFRVIKDQVRNVLVHEQDCPFLAGRIAQDNFAGLKRFRCGLALTTQQKHSPEEDKNHEPTAPQPAILPCQLLHALQDKGQIGHVDRHRGSLRFEAGPSATAGSVTASWPVCQARPSYVSRCIRPSYI